MSTYFQSIGTVIAALIAAVALIRVNRIDNQDRIRRGLWAMEEYLRTASEYIAVHNDEKKEKYKGSYLVCLLYTENELKTIMQEIDILIEETQWAEAQNELQKLCWRYGDLYEMKRFQPRRSR